MQDGGHRRLLQVLTTELLCFVPEGHIYVSDVEVRLTSESERRADLERLLSESKDEFSSYKVVVEGRLESLQERSRELDGSVMKHSREIEANTQRVEEWIFSSHESGHILWTISDPTGTHREVQPTWVQAAAG